MAPAKRLLVRRDGTEKRKKRDETIGNETGWVWWNVRARMGLEPETGSKSQIKCDCPSGATVGVENRRPSSALYI